MSYTVLARKYRSNNFDELVGQEHVAQTIKRAIESGRIAHAFLFCGTRGTGKTSTARILAKALNCQKFDRATAEPCGKCNSCLGIARGDDMDVIEIDAASNTGVDNVRDLISNAQYRPVNSRFKIYIIDEVHMLSKGAFNALLKTLEEPPEHVKFILATTEAEKVLPTIQSRCQRYDFRNIPTREIAGHLKSICKEEKIKAEEDALLLVAKAGAGSMRDSLSLLDRLLSTGEKQLSADLIELMLGLPKAQMIFDIAQAIGAGDVKQALTLTNQLITRGLAAEVMVGSLIDHLHNLLIIRTCGIESGLVEVPGLPPKELTAQAGGFDPAMLTQDIALLEELKRSLRTAQAGRALIDATLVRLALAEQFKSVTELLAGAGSGAASPSSDALKKKYDLSVAGASGVQAETMRPPSPDHSESTENAPLPNPLPEYREREQTPASDDNDDLPAVGRVWEGEKVSLGAAFKKFNSHKTEPPGFPAAHAYSSASNLDAVDTSDLNDVMSHLQHAVNEQHGIASFLSQGTIKNIGDNLAVIAFPETSLAPTMLERGNKRQVLTEALSQLLGRPTALKFEIDPNLSNADAVRPVTPAIKPQARANSGSNGASTLQPPPAPTIRVTAELKEQLHKDALIAAVVNELGGEIVKVE